MIVRYVGTRFILVYMLGATSVGSCGVEPLQNDLERSPATLSAAAVEALEKADAADGTTDKVVTKCVTCRLHMEGRSENVTSYGGYELRFCTADCKAFFEKDPETVLLNLD
jgi:YHS domain-containing protein